MGVFVLGHTRAVYLGQSSRLGGGTCYTHNARVLREAPHPRPRPVPERTRETQRETGVASAQQPRPFHVKRNQGQNGSQNRGQDQNRGRGQNGATDQDHGAWTGPRGVDGSKKRAKSAPTRGETCPKVVRGRRGDTPETPSQKPSTSRGHPLLLSLGCLPVSRGALSPSWPASCARETGRHPRPLSRALAPSPVTPRRGTSRPSYPPLGPLGGRHPPRRRRSGDAPGHGGVSPRLPDGRSDERYCSRPLSRGTMVLSSHDAATTRHDPFPAPSRGHCRRHEP